MKEVKRSVMDSESGLNKAAIEHHIGESFLNCSLC